MMIGTAEVLFVIFVITIAYIAYSLFKQLRTLEKNQARRILDLMVIGSILHWLDILFHEESSGDIKIMAAAGALIFLYGYMLLVLEKYREGRREIRS